MLDLALTVIVFFVAVRRIYASQLSDTRQINLMGYSFVGALMLYHILNRSIEWAYLPN